MSSTQRSSDRDSRVPKVWPDLLIAGASARAAAWSAARGGLQSAAADLFADADLREIAATRRIRDWPREIFSWSRRYDRNIPLVYVGGLENYPALLDSAAAQRPVAGLTGRLLGELRDPVVLIDWCSEMGFQRPRFAKSNEAPSFDVLVKRTDSASGLGIRFWEGRPLVRGEYLQEFVAGRPVSAAYLLTEAGAELLGTFRQFPPEREATQPVTPFLYRGSITCVLPCRRRLEELGKRLRDKGVRGLCGVDFIEAAGGELVVLEVNPRYTASMELIERQTGRSLIAEHLACFGFASGRAPATAGLDRATAHFGKRIVFARRPVLWTDPPVNVLPPLSKGNRAIADVPLPGTYIAEGEPVCTLFVALDAGRKTRDELIVRELLCRERALLGFLETADTTG